jgi:hypothetical protein
MFGIFFAPTANYNLPHFPNFSALKLGGGRDLKFAEGEFQDICHLLLTRILG